MHQAVSGSYPCEVHAQFELGQEVQDDAALVIQDSQVLLLVVLRVCGLVAGIQGLRAAGLALLLPLLVHTHTAAISNAECGRMLQNNAGVYIDVGRYNLRTRGT